MSLFQSNLRKQIRKLPKILKFVRLIHYYSKLFTGVLRFDAPRVPQRFWHGPWDRAWVTVCGSLERSVEKRMERDLFRNKTQKIQNCATGASFFNWFSMGSGASRAAWGHRRAAGLGLAKLGKIAKFCKFLAGSLSAVSKRNFARKYAFDSIFQALQDVHTFAPLRSHFSKKSV